MNSVFRITQASCERLETMSNPLHNDCQTCQVGASLSVFTCHDFCVPGSFCHWSHSVPLHSNPSPQASPKQVWFSRFDVHFDRANERSPFFQGKESGGVVNGVSLGALLITERPHLSFSSVSNPEMRRILRLCLEFPQWVETIGRDHLSSLILDGL